MNKIHNSIKNPIVGKVNICVKPKFAAEFSNFLNSKGYSFESDGRVYSLPIVGMPTVECCPFLLDYSDQLRDDVVAWDSNI
jgi:hypothetical protein